jgi:transglutaminase-like putative cysteine protease
VPFGSVTEIKKDFAAWFEVWRDGEPGVPREVILRDNVHDHYDVRGVWTDTLTPGTRSQTWLDTDDGRADGWVLLGRAADEARARTLRIELKQGGHRRLYLQPQAARISIEREGRAQTGYTVTVSRNETCTVGFALQEGDRVIERYVPPRRDDAFLHGRRSDAAVSPLPCYLQVPEACLAPLRDLAVGVVGGQGDPWTRARMLEAWLQGDAFTYTLRLPRLDPANPIVDFLQNSRSANCEGFAIGLTLMLRTLGHPTRYVRGFWGGDPQEARGSVILRGHHYHAWTEMYLDGAGWVPLNPTPPDRRAVDAGSVTVAASGAGAAEADETFSFLGYDAEQWGRLWAGVGRAVGAAVVDPLTWLFGPRGGHAGIPLLLLLLLLLRRRRSVARVRRLVVAPGRPLPAGPYGRALLLLARHGLRRRPTQTARAFCRAAGQRFPSARGPLEVLTDVYERERYGGGASPQARREAGDALGALHATLRAGRSASGPGNGRGGAPTIPR